MPADTTKKPGIKTSEFWVATLTAPIVAIIVALLNSIGITVTETTIMTLVGPAITYVAGRSWKKAAAEKNTGGA